MLNSKSAQFTTYFFFILTYCISQPSADIFTVTTMSSSTVEISFQIKNTQPEKEDGDINLFFGISSQPSVSIQPGMQSGKGISYTPDCIKSLSGGWIGNEYIQWFSVTFSPHNKRGNFRQIMGGVIRLTYDKPVILHRSSREVLMKSNILSVPLKKTMIKRTSPEKPDIPYSIGIRMEIPYDGIYQISGKDLIQLGIPIHRIESKYYGLFHRDKEIPIYISNPNRRYIKNDDVILFYGKFLRGEKQFYTQYAINNIYWLTWYTKVTSTASSATTAGTRISDTDGDLKKDPLIFNPDISIAAKPFYDTIHLEKDNDIRWQGDIFSIEETAQNPHSNENIDNWYWGVIGKDKLTHFEITIPSPEKNDLLRVWLKIKLTGLTSIPTNSQDHKFEILLNDQYINSPHAIWDGQNDYIFTSNAIELNKLKHGTNTVTFARLHHDSILDQAALNWIEITYLRGFDVYEDQIYFGNNPHDINRRIQFDLKGFTSPDLELWDIRNFRKFNHFKVEEVQDKYTLSFQDSIVNPVRFYAHPVSNRIKPENMVLDTIMDTWGKFHDIDYIIISKAEFLPVLQPLISVHKESGLNVSTFDIQDIYNSFSYGIQNPGSIRSMMKYLFEQNRENPPKYLLLAGDASHDMYKKNREKNSIPTHLTRIPNWGPASDDGHFATIHGTDNFPDICVGRFPARNASEMQTLVNKTVQYILYPERGYWRDNMILIGGFEPQFTVFNNEASSKIITPRMNIKRMDADPKSSYYVSGTVASNKLAEYINAGAYLINFTGHGGGNTWSDSKFFSYSDLSKLHNSQWGKSGRLPIVFSFTCLTGFFESVFYQSLGEEFLRQSANGCIAFYGASAYTKRNIDIQMARTILTYAMNNHYESLGDLINNTEILMLVMRESEAIPLIRQYNLLGDPALPWKLVPNNLKLSLENRNLKATDTLKISGNSSPLVTGSLKLNVFAENTVPWANAITTISDSVFSFQFILKKNSQTANGLIRGFVWNDSTEAVGWTRFSKDTFALFDVSISPPDPDLGDSVSISFRLESPDSLYLPQIQCRYTIDNPHENNISFDDTSFIFMVKDSQSTIWRSLKKINLGSGSQNTFFDINSALILQFYATGKLGVSDYYIFKIAGRPDLSFTSDSLKCYWQNDSLSIQCEIINKGNASVQTYDISFFIHNSNKNHDTTYVNMNTFNSPLFPGTIEKYRFSIPDTQGTLTYIGVINKNKTVEEIHYLNNTAKIFVSLANTDLFTTDDTLYSLNNGCYIVPVDSLTNPLRVFIFQNRITASQPLASSSSWVPLLGDEVTSFKMYSRPALSVSDSLNWNFVPNIKDRNFIRGSEYRMGIFAMDSLSSHWKYQGGNYDSVQNIITMATNHSGPFALAQLADSTPPEIQVFVNGKEIVYLDYAAQNRPFNIIIFDSSGIDLSSIKILLNHQILENDLKSSGINGGNLSTSTAVITAYPVKINSIDSLTVIAKDNAGNRSEKIFPYRPGENLTIRFFSCHPNPFSGKTGKKIRFAYLITDIATNVSLTIYTISGRKVWRWTNPTDLIGYQEISWDGTTQNRRSENKGYRIANGTYYAKLVVKNNKRKAEKIIRIAKLEGYRH